MKNIVIDAFTQISSVWGVKRFFMDNFERI